MSLKFASAFFLNKSSKSKQIHNVSTILDIYYTNTSSKSDIGRYLKYIKIEDKPIQFKIDTGSGYTFLPRDKFAKLGRGIPLHPAKIGFRSYTQNTFIPKLLIIMELLFKERFALCQKNVLHF